MLNLTIQNAELANMNTRTEREGEERRRGAVDLKIKATLGVDKIAALFGPADALEKFERLWEGDSLAIPGVGNIGSDREWENLNVTILPDTLDMFDEERAIVLMRAKLNKIEFSPQFSRTGDVDLRIQSHPDPEDVGALYLLQGSTVTLQIMQQSVADAGASHADAQMADTEEGVEA